MSLKELLGLNGTDISEAEIMKKIAEAKRQNLTEVEFDVGGSKVKISIPSIGFDPDADRDTW